MSIVILLRVLISCSKTLNILAKMTQDSLRLTHIKPLEGKHGFTTAPNVDGLGVKSSAYKDHFREKQVSRPCSFATPVTNEHFQNVAVTVQNARGAIYTQYGRTGGVDGRTTNLNIGRPLDNTKTILSIKTIGRDDPTTAEAQRAAAVLRILQGNLGLLTDNPWMQNIWFPQPPSESGDLELLVWPAEWTVPHNKATASKPAPSEGDNLDRQQLNKSQQAAVDTMLSRSDTNRITIIQGKYLLSFERANAHLFVSGPPGTGKTSVIAAYVKEALQVHQSGEC
jgi:regulator of nonsense transcripts 1